jgi:Ca-activated chloride channel family protein
MTHHDGPDDDARLEALLASLRPRRLSQETIMRTGKELERRPAPKTLAWRDAALWLTAAASVAIGVTLYFRDELKNYLNATWGAEKSRSDTKLYGDGGSSSEQSLRALEAESVALLAKSVDEFPLGSGVPFSDSEYRKSHRQYHAPPADGNGFKFQGKLNPEDREDGKDIIPSGESYSPVRENDFLSPRDAPLSTFGLDVDTASYSNVRRFLTQNALPPRDAVRIEEMLNYFPYSYAPPAEGAAEPFAVHLETAACPWNLRHRLVRVGVKGREIAADKRPRSNLVFLIDVSGSMDAANRLPLVQQALRLLVERLNENDRVAIVVYAGASGLVLPSVHGGEKRVILDAVDRLSAGGSTNGAAGIELAYQVAVQNFIPGGTNRVILCTDGDFNVGVSDRGGLVRLIEEKRKTGVFLTCLGFGMGNYKDDTFQALANHGNGQHAYIDDIREARKVFVEQMSGTLVTIAKDVKAQVEFNPAKVSAYRLVGYEKRLMRAEEFRDDKKDSGEIGAGHTVTALYEVVPAGVALELPGVPKLKYREQPAEAKGGCDEMLTLRMRWKRPDGETGMEREWALTDAGAKWGDASADFKFAAAVAGFGQLLRDSRYKGSLTWEGVAELAAAGTGHDPGGYRAEFRTLVETAKRLSGR